MKDLIETLEEYANGFINVIAPPEEDVKELLEHIYNQDKEIERLKNIINELEKELEDMATLKTDEYGNTRKITHIDINWLLSKVKELKGSDKE